MKAINSCQEEEFAPAFAALWRWRGGWRPTPFSLRGPESHVFLLGALLGVWRFSRKPKRLADDWRRLIGREVVEVCEGMGSSGMAGPGFFGLALRSERHVEWMVFRLWSATGWLLLDDLPLADTRLPDRTGQQGGGSSLVGCRFRSYEADHEKLVLTFDVPDGRQRILSLTRDGRCVPVWPGSGQHKVIPAEEQLDDVVVMSRKGRLWLPCGLG